MSEGKILQGIKLESTLKEYSMGKFFFEFGEKFKDNISQVDATIDMSETYSSVKQRSIRIAIALQAKGVTSSDVIVSCSNNTIDNMIPLIASLYLGAKIANLDSTLSVRTTRHLLNLVSPKIIFVEECFIDLIEKSLKDTNLKTEIIVFGESINYVTFSELVKPKPNEDKFRPADVNVHDAAVLFFSSGTTGLPKAICHSGTRIFCRDMSGENTFRLIEKYKLTSIFMAPIYTYSLTNVKNPEKYNTSSLRCILTGGTSISSEQFKRLDNLFENADIIFGYGMSEIGMLSVFNPEIDDYFIKTKVGSCGKVVPATTLKVVDFHTDKLLGPNEKGEIRVKSEALMKGYYNQGSSHCFDSDGFLKTGDIGYYDEDKCIYVIERMKEMFKYQSWHIVPSSIEAVILEHPAVKEVVVFGIPRGEEGDVPAACIVLKDDFNVDKEEIEKFVEERVSDKERLRGGIIFSNNLPKTPSGKLIRMEVKNIVIKSM
ncbi:4-coumarate--CoA ligase 1-like, partial [Asbolus verrucosus]